MLSFFYDQRVPYRATMQEKHIFKSSRCHLCHHSMFLTLFGLIMWTLPFRAAWVTLTMVTRKFLQNLLIWLNKCHASLSKILPSALFALRACARLGQLQISQEKTSCCREEIEQMTFHRKMENLPWKILARDQWGNRMSNGWWNSATLPTKCIRHVNMIHWKINYPQTLPRVQNSTEMIKTTETTGLIVNSTHLQTTATARSELATAYISLLDFFFTEVYFFGLSSHQLQTYHTSFFWVSLIKTTRKQIPILVPHQQPMHSESHRRPIILFAYAKFQQRRN